MNVLDLTLDYMNFFDGTDVSSFITLSSTSYTTDIYLMLKVVLQVTDIQGKVEFSFRILSIDLDNQIYSKFKTGDVDFRLTSSETNVKVPTPYQQLVKQFMNSKGIVNTTQQTIEITRDNSCSRDCYSNTIGNKLIITIN